MEAVGVRLNIRKATLRAGDANSHAGSDNRASMRMQRNKRFADRSQTRSPMVSTVRRGEARLVYV